MRLNQLRTNLHGPVIIDLFSRLQAAHRRPKAVVAVPAVRAEEADGAVKAPIHLLPRHFPTTVTACPIVQERLDREILRRAESQPKVVQ